MIRLMTLPVAKQRTIIRLSDRFKAHISAAYSGNCRGDTSISVGLERKAEKT